MKTIEEIIADFDTFCEQTIRANKINHISGGTINGVIEHLKLFQEKLELLNRLLVDEANETLAKNTEVEGLKDELLSTAKTRIEQFISENK